MDSGITPVMPIGDGGFAGGDSFMWIFGLLILLGLFNGGGFLGGANNQYATSAEVQRGFDTQNLNAQTSAILNAVNNGTAQSVAATNATFHDNLAAMQNLYNETQRDIAALQVGQANMLAAQNQCCCETKMLIQETSAQNRYDNLVNTQKILDVLAQNKIEALQAQINKLELNQATSGLLKFPTSWTYEAGQFPPFVVGA